jgi:hypothetical protein
MRRQSPQRKEVHKRMVWLQQVAEAKQKSDLKNGSPHPRKYYPRLGLRPKLLKIREMKVTLQRKSLRKRRKSMRKKRAAPGERRTMLAIGSLVRGGVRVQTKRSEIRRERREKRGKAMLAKSRQRTQIPTTRIGKKGESARSGVIQKKVEQTAGEIQRNSRKEGLRKEEKRSDTLIRRKEGETKTENQTENAATSAKRKKRKQRSLKEKAGTPERIVAVQKPTRRWSPQGGRMRLREQDVEEKEKAEEEKAEEEEQQEAATIQ